MSTVSVQEHVGSDKQDGFNRTKQRERERERDNKGRETSVDGGGELLLPRQPELPALNQVLRETPGLSV